MTIPNHLNYHYMKETHVYRHPGTVNITFMNQCLLKLYQENGSGFP